MYMDGKPVGPCEHDWHKGPDYDPGTLKLTAFDEEFLAEQKVSIR